MCDTVCISVCVYTCVSVTDDVLISAIVWTLNSEFFLLSKTCSQHDDVDIIQLCNESTEVPNARLCSVPQKEHTFPSTVKLKLY